MSDTDLAPVARHAAHPTPNRAGFTLIELVIVMAIMGIIGAVIIPSLTKSPPINPAAAAEPLAKIMRAARRMASDSGRPVQLVIDPVGRRYVAILPGANKIAAEGTINMGNASITTDSLRATFVFQPGGTAMGDSIYVSGGFRPIMVTVRPWTGEPKLYVR